MSGGYSADQVASLLESTVQRYTRRAEGSTNSSAALLDLVSGWTRVNGRVRAILSKYVAAEIPPPAIDIETARAEVKRKQELGEPHHRESREIRETMAVHSLGAAMSTRRTGKPYLTGVGAANRGFCAECADRVEAGRVWRMAGDRRLWHEECWTPPAVSATG